MILKDIINIQPILNKTGFEAFKISRYTVNIFIYTNNTNIGGGWQPEKFDKDALFRLQEPKLNFSRSLFSVIQ